MIDNHRHPFAVKALVVKGETWLTVEGAMRHLRPAERFELERGVAGCGIFPGGGAL